MALLPGESDELVLIKYFHFCFCRADTFVMSDQDICTCLKFQWMQNSIDSIANMPGSYVPANVCFIYAYLWSQVCYLMLLLLIYLEKGVD